MTELNKLFAILLTIHDLRYPDSHKKPLLDAITKMIKNEMDICNCTGNYKEDLLTMLLVIDRIHA